MTESQGLLVGVVLLFALFVYTFWPAEILASQEDKNRLGYLLERKDQIFENLRDLNFEYRAGKYLEDEFFAQRAQLEIEAAQLMTEIIDLQRDCS
jgi:hypothetical protein